LIVRGDPDRDSAIEALWNDTFAEREREGMTELPEVTEPVLVTVSAGLADRNIKILSIHENK